MAKEKLGIMDLLTFAKAGYTPSDVKEIMAMQQNQPDDSGEGSGEKKAEEAGENNAKGAESANLQNAGNSNDNSKDNQNDEGQPDYKQMFEEQKRQIEELQEKLQKAQSLNTKQNVAPSAPQLTGQELVNNIFKEVIF